MHTRPGLWRRVAVRCQGRGRRELSTEHTHALRLHHPTAHHSQLDRIVLPESPCCWLFALRQHLPWFPPDDAAQRKTGSEAGLMHGNVNVGQHHKLK